MSATTGTPERGQLPDTGGAEVKPVTRKFDGCTLSTKPVCGPSAAA